MFSRLRDLREDKDLSQSEIAKILRISYQQYGKYERGEHMMGMDKYITLARFYNVSLDYLAGLTDVPRKLY